MLEIMNEDIAIFGILKNWRANGVKTYADYLNNERERADKNTK